MLVLTAALALLAAWATTEAARAEQDTPEAPTTVKEVMMTMTIPSSEVIFDAAAEPPEDDQRWVAVQESAATLGEAGMLLMTSQFAKDDTTWMDRARGLVDQAEATLKAVEARDIDALWMAGDGVYLACDACHENYMER